MMWFETLSWCLDGILDVRVDAGMIKTLGDTGMGLVYFAHGKDMNFGASEGRLLRVELCPLKKNMLKS